jgi:diguanylate cyclase (GGDEF)-like protein
MARLRDFCTASGARSAENSPAMALTYNSWLVALSIAVAILVSYTALGLAARVAESRGVAGRAWLILGACSMGVGIWSMHFLGMLALSLPIQLRYSIQVTLVSLGVAILTSGFAIRIASSKQLGLARHLVCSVVMASGIVAMHYVGMDAIVIEPGISYAAVPVAASILIALAASYCALWLTFILRSAQHRHVRAARLGAAVIMGCAIAGMHYTGMSAASIQPGAICTGGIAFDSGWLAVSVAVAALGILTITLLTSVFDGHMAARARVYAENLDKADQLLLYQATHDSLTGLPNRGVYLQGLKLAIDRVSNGGQRMFAALFLDLDRFKLVNDSLGHAAGDALLRQISQRLTEELRTVDIATADLTADVVSRFGGDEFLLLLNTVKSSAEAKLVAERLIGVLSARYNINGRDVHCSASIGIVTSEQCCTNADDVVRNADVAMYEAKRAGRGCVVVFNETMHTEVSRHVLIETSLRRAIGTDELSVVYQPIVDLSTGQLVSAEALVRWQNPVLGCVSPTEFIPIAEESGLIVALDQWVRTEACRAMKTWRERDPKSAPKTVSVNVSRAELARNQAFRVEIKELLQRMNLPAHCLQLEVTERDVMRNPEEALLLMRDLRALGVKLAMDDFGTGTSSLGILRTYPFDTIKIDRSFVQGLVGSADVLAVIHATINLVEHLGMASLVEGIEQEAQVSVLLSIGCRYGQGFLFSKPVPADRLVASIKPRPDSRKSAEWRQHVAMIENFRGLMPRKVS